ncbi:replication initiator protein A [Deinococcus sp.]|uniref:replication initiator protein A n=1 Tax=Deinococcus sp. TaxID=47478 RepID=UPI0025F170C0|nr:replication initiator protein A [Deinococcus sp.]
MAHRDELAKPTDHQYTEFNVTHLGLIPIQNRLPDSVRLGWVSEVGDRKNGAGIRSMTAHEDGVPHGTASDLFAGIVTGSVAAREGGEQVIEVTAADLARLSHMALRTENYQSIRRNLNQLRHTNFNIWNKWRTPLHSVAEERSFSLIDEVETRTTEHAFNADQVVTTYRIRLNPNIVQSIDGALTLMTNRQVLAQLASPASRGLYRLLEAWRRDPADFTQTSPRLTISARDLVEACRLLGARHEPATLLRPLFHASGPFAQLKDAGYLLDVSTAGRGWDTTIGVSFAQSNTAVNTTGLRLLREAGVTGKNATSLASLHTTEEIECALWTVDQKVKVGGIRNPPGLVISVLKDSDFPAHLEQFRRRPKRVVAPRPLQRQAAPPPEPEVPRSETELMRSASNALMSLSAIKRITLEQRTALQVDLDTGKVSPRQICQLVTMTADMVNSTIAAWKD